MLFHILYRVIYHIFFLRTIRNDEPHISFSAKEPFSAARKKLLILRGAFSKSPPFWRTMWALCEALYVQRKKIHCTVYHYPRNTLMRTLCKEEYLPSLQISRAFSSRGQLPCGEFRFWAGNTKKLCNCANSIICE